MYKINREKKTIEEIKEKTLSEMQCKERQDLQEWIANKPEVLGEELLIIQKEFSGWDKTNERLDLLALDNSGRLVVIENKSDDSGRDVTWQATKYASYVSTLKLEDTVKIYSDYLKKVNPNKNAKELNEEAKKNIAEFLGKEYDEIGKFNQQNTQRIILVSRLFRNEVLSAVKWLSEFKININCVEIKTYGHNGEYFLNAEKVFPLKTVDQYMMKIIEKNKDDIERERRVLKSEAMHVEFWQEFIPEFNKKSDIYKSISYINRKDHWLSVSAGIKGDVHYSFLACGKYCGVSLEINAGTKEKSKKIYEKLHKHRDEIENGVNSALKIIGYDLKADYDFDWALLEDKKQSRITIKNNNFSVDDRENRNKIKEFMSTTMIAFKKEIDKLIDELKK